ncbi:hypothetical protein MSM1_05695 [Mycobacterium sp. SM1]|nr:hypothetical protein [Mycobacterium sp. SM1]
MFPVAARGVDENMRDVPVGTVGEIVYREPTLVSGATGLAIADALPGDPAGKVLKAERWARSGASQTRNA